MELRIALVTAEPSGSMCAWTDGLRCAESAAFGCHDAFVSDDLVSYPQTVQEDSGPSPMTLPVLAEAVTTVCRQPANWGPDGSPPKGNVADRPIVAVVRQPQAAATRRFHQSNFSNRRQMGGVKQTNRFFARRQFA